MTHPSRTLAASTVYPTSSAPSLANAQLSLTELMTQIDWQWGKVIRVTGSGTKTLTGTKSQTLGLDGNTLVIVESMSGTITLQLPLADDLCNASGEGAAVCIVRRDSTSNTLTVSCQGSDKIDAVTNWTSVPLAADGDRVMLRPTEADTFVVLASAIAPVRETVTATNASYSVPAGCRVIRFKYVEGAGGGSGGVDGQSSSNFNGASGGGGAGAHSELDLDVRTLSTVSVTIGAAGAAGTAGANDGGDGGDTIISWSAGASSVTSGGGQGGKGVTAANGAVARGGAGGTPATSGSMTLATGLVQSAGAPGGQGICLPSTSGAVVSGAGGSGLLGGGGRSETAAGTVGTAGTGYGAGAGGSTATNNTATNVAGQAGQAGAVVIEKHFLRAP